ncbi:MAG: metallophosphatase family protein [Proteobacteria bacterium]|nr:metallophosphatase family protein [Pseudomonadota bacterium]
MKIGVMSDTHLAHVSDELKTIVEEVFRDTDLILHAGDIVSGRVLSYLESAGVIAVCGNMDYPDVSETLPLKRTLTAGDFKIGLTHGYGSPHGLAQRLRPAFGQIDCLIFGHSHQAMNRQEGSTLYFNPGTALGSVRGRGHSVGLLRLTDRIQGEIIELRSE